MNHEDKVTEQQINAFIDDELDAEERAMVFRNAEVSSEVDIQLCEYRKLKDLVRHAYSSVPVSEGMPAASHPARKYSKQTLFAATVLVIVSTLLGAVLGQTYLQRSPSGASDSQLSAGRPAATASQGRYIVHLTDNNADTMQAALVRVETLVKDASVQNPVRVELVTNDRGIDLLRSDHTPYAARIAELAGQHVVFIACARRIERLREAGEVVLLVPEAEDRYTAMERVVDRLQDGWSYEAI